MELQINQINKVKPEQSSLSGDLWGGLAAMLVALPSSIAFGILVYTSLGPEYAAQGALAGILGAAALGITASLVGRTDGLISAPCAPAAAVLSGLALLLTGKVEIAEIPALLALTALFAGVLQILFGAIGGGRLIKFIPFPVVSGYLSGVGLLITLGQLPKLLGLPKGVSLPRGLVSPELWKLPGLVVGLVTIAVMGTAPRFTKKVPAPILGLLAGILTYFILALFNPELLVITGNPLVIGPVQSSGNLIGLVAGRTKSLLKIDFSAIALILVPALTLAVLLSIDTLKTCVGLGVITRKRNNSDRELIGQGLGNLASFLVGGMPGAGTMGPTLVNVTSGGRTPLSGVIAGILSILALLLLGGLIAWVPIGALAGILIVIAWRMFDKGMFRLLGYPAGRQDFAVITGVVIVALTVDLIAASGVGVALAILLFIRDHIRASVIRRKLYLNEISSKTRRHPAEREILDRFGDQGVFCELQDDLFFGTTDQLFSQLEPDLNSKKYILLDMRHVQTMDYTAAHLFEQMQAQLAERGGQLIFSGMPSAMSDQRDFEKYLNDLGVTGNEGIMISETLDGALEWMEEKIIKTYGVAKKNEEDLLGLNEIYLFQGLDEKTLNSLKGCITEMTVAQGQKIFSQGEPGDKIFLIRRGNVRILLPLGGGKYHHVATIASGGFFGELNFLDNGIRSADAEAKVTTSLYLISYSGFKDHVQNNPGLGGQVFQRIALAIAQRLRQTDAELSTLEYR
jgi:SulP family sulfate permease